MQQGLHCFTCDATIFSEHRHDFKGCKCPSDYKTWIFVDVGKDYFRCVCSDDSKFETVERE